MAAYVHIPINFRRIEGRVESPPPPRSLRYRKKHGPEMVKNLNILCVDEAYGGTQCTRPTCGVTTVCQVKVVAWLIRKIKWIFMCEALL